MKKRFGIAAIALAAGCAVALAGCSSCGSDGKKNEAAFSSNWYADTSFKYIQPTFNEDDEAYAGKEVVTYTVTHDTETAGNRTYSVEYADGTYTTEFYATTFEKTMIDEAYSAAYPDNLTVYYYRTELFFPSVTFKLLNSDVEPAVFDDGESTVTECYFTDVNNHLRPLYSKITINCHAPAEYQVSSINAAYETVSQTVTTSYKYDGTAAKTTVEEGDNKTEFVTSGLGKTDNSLIDVSGLNIAVRAMQLGSGLSQTISVFSPAGKMQDYTFTGSVGNLSEAERTAIEDILSDDSLKLYVPSENKTLNTVCVTAALNADMKGASQKYWFAAIDNTTNNRSRATMVKMSVPVPFSLGTLNYSLKEISSTLYHE